MLDSLETSQRSLSRALLAYRTHRVGTTDGGATATALLDRALRECCDETGVVLPPRVAEAIRLEPTWSSHAHRLLGALASDLRSVRGTASVTDDPACSRAIDDAATRGAEVVIAMRLAGAPASLAGWLDATVATLAERAHLTRVAREERARQGTRVRSIAPSFFAAVGVAATLGADDEATACSSVESELTEQFERVSLLRDAARDVTAAVAAADMMLSGFLRARTTLRRAVFGLSVARESTLNRLTTTYAVAGDRTPLGRLLPAAMATRVADAEAFLATLVGVVRHSDRASPASHADRIRSALQMMPPIAAQVSRGRAFRSASANTPPGPSTRPTLGQSGASADGARERVFANRARVIEAAADRGVPVGVLLSEVAHDATTSAPERRALSQLALVTAQTYAASGPSSRQSSCATSARLASRLAPWTHEPDASLAERARYLLATTDVTTKGSSEPPEPMVVDEVVSDAVTLIRARQEVRLLTALAHGPLSLRDAILTDYNTLPHTTRFALAAGRVYGVASEAATSPALREPRPRTRR